MKIAIQGLRLGNVKVFFSRLGYHVERNGSYSRRAGTGQFPRYHAYVDYVGDMVHINVHLDAKAASYTGTSAHAGEYDGPLIETEMARIQAAVQ